MEANVPFCPINISALGADGVMLVPDTSAQLIEQTRLSFCYCLRHALFHVCLILYECAVVVPRSGAMRLAGDQTNLHNGSLPCPCITARAVLLNIQLEIQMKSFEKVILIGSLALACYSAYVLVAGISRGILCYQSRCTRYGVPGENFMGYVTMYALFAVFGLVSAWRSKKNIGSNSALHTDASRQ